MSQAERDDDARRKAGVAAMLAWLPIQFALAVIADTHADWLLDQHPTAFWTLLAVMMFGAYLCIRVLLRLFFAIYRPPASPTENQ